MLKIKLNIDHIELYFCVIYGVDILVNVYNHDIFRLSVNLVVGSAVPYHLNK